MCSSDLAAGAVIRAEPPSGTVVARGSKVSLYLSTGPAPTPTPVPVKVPDVRGMVEADAIVELADRGFTIGERPRRTDPNGPPVSSFAPIVKFILWSDMLFEAFVAEFEKCSPVLKFVNTHFPLQLGNRHFQLEREPEQIMLVRALGQFFSASSTVGVVRISVATLAITSTDPF